MTVRKIIYDGKEVDLQDLIRKILRDSIVSWPHDYGEVLIITGYEDGVVYLESRVDEGLDYRYTQDYGSPSVIIFGAMGAIPEELGDGLEWDDDGRVWDRYAEEYVDFGELVDEWLDCRAGTIVEEVRQRIEERIQEIEEYRRQ